MLSYMLPADEKPSGGYNSVPECVGFSVMAEEENFHHKYNFVSGQQKTFNTPNHDEKPIIRTTGSTSRQPNLKRVSFGSSKGSMVETLIYDSPVPEEETVREETEIEPVHLPVAAQEDPEAAKFGSETGTPLKPPSKVRVTFFESEKPLYLNSPDDELDLPLMAGHSPESPQYLRQVSSESGKDNPFRPDSELSREADEIVEMIKEGKPLAKVYEEEKPVEEDLVTPAQANSVQAASPTKAGANGSAVGPESVEVERGVVSPPGEPSQAERVVIKKKQKCRCCVIQ